MPKKGYPFSQDRASGAPPDSGAGIGTVKFFNAAKGYGFITTDPPSGSGPDVAIGFGATPDRDVRFFSHVRSYQLITGDSGTHWAEIGIPTGPRHLAAMGMSFRVNEAGEPGLEQPEQGSEGRAFDRAVFMDDPVVDAAVAAVLERVPEIVRARQEALSQETIDLLVDAYLKSAPTAPARHRIEMDNARERVRFVEEFPCYTSREVAELAGHEAANASATATRWKKARRIVGLPWKGGDLYPAFQFREGRPRPIIARLMETLPEGLSSWQIAFWLTSSNGWLGGATPLEKLDDEAALIAAATRESEALGG